MGTTCLNIGNADEICKINSADKSVSLSEKIFSGIKLQCNLPWKNWNSSFLLLARPILDQINRIILNIIAMRRIPIADWNDFLKWFRWHLIFFFFFFCLFFSFLLNQMLMTISSSILISKIIYFMSCELSAGIRWDQILRVKCNRIKRWQFPEIIICDDNIVPKHKGANKIKTKRCWVGLKSGMIRVDKPVIVFYCFSSATIVQPWKSPSQVE